ncbi:MAG TPA: ribonuclease Z [Blastocatellia bacterium]|nr:ribonuclease Z [Blastocatellia bacterium]
MSSRKFIALGTASQVPTRQRNHNGYFLKWDEAGILFDPGEGTQRQMILANVSASEITKIFITHFHGDHCLGLAGIIQRLSLDKVPQTVEVCYPASGQKYFDNLKNASIFYNVASIRECPISEPGVVFTGDKFTIEARRLDHTVESWGYRLQEPDTVTMLPEKLEALGIRGPAVGTLKRSGRLEIDGQVITADQVSVPRAGQSMAFIMDTRMCEAARVLAANADLLVCESTYLSSESAEAEKNGHLTAAQAATIARDAGADRLVLTHFSQRYTSTEEFLLEAARIHPNVIVVKDSDEVEISRRRD